MMSEAEKRLHRCCFAGHRPESIQLSEEQAKLWLREQIDQAVHDGFLTFITGMGMGVDLWAAQIVLSARERQPDIHLIAVVPYPAFSAKWNADWMQTYRHVLKNADLVKQISEYYTQEAMTNRNRWMVDHAARLIGIYNGTEGYTGDLVHYALEQKITVSLYPFPKITTGSSTERAYPLNLLDAIMACETYQASPLVEATDLPHDFDHRLEVALSVIADDRALSILLSRFRDGKTLQKTGDQEALSRERVRQLIDKYVKRLRHPDILRYLECQIKNIPEKTSQTMLKRLKDALNSSDSASS